MKTSTQFNLDTQTSNDAVRRSAMPGKLNWYDLSYIGFLVTAAAAIAAGLLR
jgi:hypothetical protein